jgi:hypothetical protein
MGLVGQSHAPAAAMSVYWNGLSVCIMGPTGYTVFFQFIMINSLYMFPALICSSSGGSVYTTIGVYIYIFVLKLVELVKITYVHFSTYAS